MSRLYRETIDGGESLKPTKISWQSMNFCWRIRQSLMNLSFLVLPATTLDVFAISCSTCKITFSARAFSLSPEITCSTGKCSPAEEWAAGQRRCFLARLSPPPRFESVEHQRQHRTPRQSVSNTYISSAVLTTTFISLLQALRRPVAHATRCWTRLFDLQMTRRDWKRR